MPACSPAPERSSCAESSPKMSVTEIAAKFSSAEVDAVSGIAADIAAKVSADGVPSLEKNGLMDALEVCCGYHFAI